MEDIAKLEMVAGPIPRGLLMLLNTLPRQPPKKTDL